MDERKIQLPLRIDKPLHDRLKAAAERQRRSINAQLTVIIEEWLDEHESGPQP